MAKRKIIFIITSFVVLICCSIGIVIGVSAEELKTEVVIPTEAYIGDKIIIPEYKATIDNNEYIAEVKIITPDGSEYSGSSLVLSSAGLYTFEYAVNGKVVKTEKCLCVRRPQDLFKVNDFAQCVGVTNYVYDDSYRGLKFQVEKGAKISFARELDMTAFTKDDVLLEFLIEPTLVGSADFGRYTVTFTDVEDENSTLTFYMTDSKMDACNGMATYVRVGGNGQQAGGWEGPKWNTTDIYGTPLYGSFLGIKNDRSLSLKIFYDDAEHAVYGYHGYDYRQYGKTLIADLDDPSVFGASIWDGFTSGKVTVTITFDNFTGTKGNFFILNCGGFDLGQDCYKDTTAPEISVNLNGEDCAPNSVVGYTYTLFDATAIDNLDESVDVIASVVYTNPANGNVVDIMTDGNTFVTDRNGKYTITYTACDLSGNKAQKTFSFFCTGEDSSIVVETTDADKNVTVYDVVTVGGIKSVSASGGNGNLSISCNVFDPNGTAVALSSNCFVPDKLGEYRVEYTAQDYFGKIGKSIVKITVNPLSAPVFINDIILPEVLISGFTYSLPTMAAKECSGNSIVDATVKTYVDGIEKNGSFTAPESSSVTITYKASGTSGNAEDRVYVVPVVNGNNGKNQAAYFYSKDVLVTENKENISLEFNKQSSIIFANPINPYQFTLNMSLVDEKTNYATVRIVLSDVDDPKFSVTFTLHISGKSVSVETADGVVGEMYVKGNDFSLKFENSSGLITDTKNASVGLVRTDDNGNVFNGFDGAVWTKIFFEDVTGESTLNLRELNNQKLGYRQDDASSASDNTKPQIILNGEYVYKCVQNTKFTIYSAQAYDVLSEIKSFVVSVTSPSGSKIIDSKSAKEQYEIDFDEIGDYGIIYTAVDLNGNTSTERYYVQVLDDTSPVLTVNFDRIKTLCRVGTKIALPKVSVTDNSEQVFYDIFLQMPDNEMRLLVHSENGTETSYIKNYDSSFNAGNREFYLQNEGKYILTIMAYDGNFNCVAKSIEIMVVKG